MPPKGWRTRQSSGDFGAAAELPEAWALPTTKVIIASIDFETKKSTKKTKTEKEKEATYIVSKNLVKYNLLTRKSKYFLKKQLTTKCHACWKQQNF